MYMLGHKIVYIVSWFKKKTHHTGYVCKKNPKTITPSEKNDPLKKDIYRYIYIEYIFNVIMNYLGKKRKRKW